MTASPESPAAAGPDVRASIPNALTASRVVVAIALFVMLALWSYADSPARGTRGVGGAEAVGGAVGGVGGATIDIWLLVAAALFVLAASTDALDGYLARRWRVVSVFGRIMDPFADKLLVIGTFAFLAGPGFMPGTTGAAPGAAWEPVSGVHPWMVVVILGRELLVTSIRAEAESRGISFAADWSGKLKMVLQSVCIPGVMLTIALGAGESEGGRGLIRVLVWTTVLATAWSAVPYAVRGWGVMRKVGR